MTEADYKRHIDHRLNLLTIFRNKFENETDDTIHNKNLDDFYKCSKDISIQMTRSLLFELGIKLTKNKDEIDSLNGNSPNDKEVLERIQDFNIIKINPKDPNELKDDIKHKLIVVLKIANRAISHIVEDEVDHVLVRHSDALEYLIPVINYVEEKVNSNILSHSC